MERSYVIVDANSNLYCGMDQWEPDLSFAARWSTLRGACQALDRLISGSENDARPFQITKYVPKG